MRALGESLGAEFEALPSPDRIDEPEALERWRAECVARGERDHVIVCVWNESAEPAPLVELEEALWERRFERPYLLWNVALGVAARRCRAAGAIAALVQTPAALDASGLCPEMSIGDGVVALVRSLAASEGARGVRANTVTTPLGLVGDQVIAPSPPLEIFPGRLEVEVAGALRLALSSEAAGMTGRVFGADGGRSFA